MLVKAHIDISDDMLNKIAKKDPNNSNIIWINK
jgi:hypothetical protein